jgi:wyosine [tRNA(Phe)-imidazoG37] synthetase (radical SAM superfamily)
VPFSVSGAVDGRGFDGQPGLPIAFGPVRSRRLGWSLGINHLPPKTRSDACVCCKIGATDHARLERLVHIPPVVIVDAVATRMAECRASEQPIDYAAFVPDGEPTLDAHLGAAIRGVARLSLPAVALVP